MRVSALAMALLFTPVLALAQPPAVLQPPAPTFPESFLWNAESRGPLLIVLPLAEKDGQLVSCGTLTAYAPKSAPRLKWEHLPEPHLFGSLGEFEKWELLQESLTERQWKLLGSSAGLGQTDLTRDQKKLFFALLPDPLTVSKPDGSSVKATEEQRKASRLRLSKRFHYAFVDNDGRQIAAAGIGSTNPSGLRLGGGNVVAQPPIVLSGVPIIGRLINPGVSGTLQEARIAFVTTEDLPVQSFTLRLNDSALRTDDIILSSTSARATSNFGATFSAPEGLHLKPSELDFASPALDKTVPLAGADTVREVVRRVATATGYELYCDPRYATRRVYLRGESARAGDILKAVCWGTAGTFRRVGTAYVLTEDLTPLAIRLGKIQDWRTGAQARLDALRVSTDRERAEYQQKYIDWSNTRLTLTSRPGERVPLSQLPENLRREIQGQMDQWTKTPNGDPNRAPLNQAVIHYTPRMELELLVPMVGSVPVPWGSRPLFPSEEQEPTALPVPKALPARTLAATLTSLREAPRLAKEAKAAGFTALWVQVEPDQQALLAAAIAAGKTEGLAVHALVRPLRTKGAMEQTVEGKRSAVYLRPELLESQAVVLPKLKALAATPGLAGLVFSDLVPTGYVADGTDWKEILGYSEALRLACLRKDGPDPVDLSDNGLQSNAFISRGSRITRLSFLSYSSKTTDWFQSSPFELWQPFHTVRREAVDGFVEGLTRSLQQAQPGLVIERQSSDKTQFGKLPRIELPDSNATEHWNRLVSSLQQSIERKPKPERVVLDGTNAPLETVLGFLTRLKEPVKE